MDIDSSLCYIIYLFILFKFKYHIHIFKVTVPLLIMIPIAHSSEGETRATSDGISNISLLACIPVERRGVLKRVDSKIGMYLQSRYSFFNVRSRHRFIFLRLLFWMTMTMQTMVLRRGCALRLLCLQYSARKSQTSAFPYDENAENKTTRFKPTAYKFMRKH